ASRGSGTVPLVDLRLHDPIPQSLGIDPELLAHTTERARPHRWIPSRLNSHPRGSLPKLVRVLPRCCHAPHPPVDSEPPPDPGRFIDDPRLVNLERPALWQALSDRQVFLVSPWTARIKGGPAATVSTAVPDKHYFRGSFGGKDVLPLYRDAAGAQPNITRGLLDLLAERLGVPVSPEDFLAYCYAVL